MAGLFSEIRRRKVLEGAIAYVVAGWVIIQVAVALEASLDLPDWADRSVSIAVIAGFPVALILSWLFDISFAGIKRTADADAAALMTTAAPVRARTPAPAKSIAVLPFVDMSPEHDQEYLGDGVAEEILNALVKVAQLKVAGRTSSFAFKSQTRDMREIGEALSVAYVLEGSVRKQANRVRITAQLIHAADGFHLWSETYDGDLTDIFDLQDKIARGIVSELKIILDSADDRLANKLTRSPEAYENFVLGRQLVHLQHGQETLPRAVEYLKKAVAFDPDFAEAWAWLADAHYSLPEHSKTKHWKEHKEAAARAVARALELNADLPQAWHAAGYRAAIAKRMDDVVASFEKAHQLSPSLAEMKAAFGEGLASIGLTTRGLALMHEGLDQEPLMPALNAVLAIVQENAGLMTEAEATYRRSFEMGFGDAVVPYAARIARNGRPDEAANFLRQNYSKIAGVTRQMLILPLSKQFMVLAFVRQSKFARFQLCQIVPMLAATPLVQPNFSIAVTLAWLGHATAFFKAQRTVPTAYLFSSMVAIWSSTDEARRIRTHKDFPKFADDIGLVRAWQKYGWPPQITPLPGTDGSNLQFTCA